MKIKLHGVEETMLIPLLIKAEETCKPSPRLYDKKSVEMISKIDYDFSKYQHRKFSAGGVIARSVMLDRSVSTFIGEHPDAVCICIGCGLDARFYRMDNGRIDSYDLDLPNVMNIRTQLLPEQERVHCISCSALDRIWTQEVAAEGRDVIIILEGILMYFTERQVKELFDLLADCFPGATVLAELFPASLIKSGRRHETVSKTGAVFRFGAKNGRDIERLCPRAKFISQQSLNAEMKTYGFSFWLFGTLPGLKNCNDFIAVYHLLAKA